MPESEINDDAEEQLPPKEDPALLARLRSDGEQVLAEAFDANRERFWHLISFRMDRRIAARIDADDVLQEAFVAATKRLEHYLRDEGYTLFIWLRMIVAQTLVDVHRRHLGTEKRSAGREISIRGNQYPQTTSVSLATQLVASQTSVSSVVQRGEMGQTLSAALDQMSPLDQEVIALRHFEGLTNVEAAQVLAISVTAASNRYVRALSRLKVILEEMNLEL